MESLLPQPGLGFTILMFALVIGVLVTIHEFGHYLAGRWFGVRADAFSIGFGKELLGWTDRRGTRWKIAALPLGGYVKFAGDANAASVPSADAVSRMSTEEQAGTLQAKPLWQRATIVAAGPITNFLFAIGVFAAFFMAFGHPYTPATVDVVVEGSPAEQAGLRQGDRIVELGGTRVDRFEDVMRTVAVNTGTPLTAVVERNGREFEIDITPAVIEESDRFGNQYRKGQLGVASTQSRVEPVGPLRALGYAVEETAGLVKLMAGTLAQIVTGDRSVDELGGPLKIAQFSGQQASMGPVTFVQFMALVSINLGFINLLPVPMLDGGHLLLYAVEGVRRRPLSPRVQELAFMSGFVALISLMLFLTWNDLSSFGVWRHLAGLLG